MTEQYKYRVGDYGFTRGGLSYLVIRDSKDWFIFVRITLPNGDEYDREYVEDGLIYNEELQDAHDLLPPIGNKFDEVTK